MTSNKSVKLIEHVDRLGNVITVDSIVAVAHKNRLMIGRVTKLHPKMISVKEILKEARAYSSGEHNKYPHDLVRIPDSDAVMYILRNT